MMKGTLYIHTDRASSDGHNGTPSVEYAGGKPDRVICLHVYGDVLYFTDDRDAHDAMQAMPVERVRLLPVID